MKYRDSKEFAILPKRCDCCRKWIWFKSYYEDWELVESIKGYEHTISYYYCEECMVGRHRR